MSRILRTNNDKKIKEAYFRWLCDLVGRGGPPGHNNHELLKLLHEIKFYWTVPNDDNRAADGVKLRERFADIHLTEDCPCLDGECTMLEMLVALAKAMDFQLWQNRQVGDRTGKWFWGMVDRLELEEFGDYDSDDEHEIKMRYNRQRIDDFLERRYSRTGEGGLFPLSGRFINGRPMPDQRKTELWYQLNYYIIENYAV